MSGNTDAGKTEDRPKVDTWAIVQKAAKRAGQGGLAGAAAMAINVMSLMWMRTAINYQYRYGTGTMQAFKTLYADGGIPRFYRGLVPALLQGPLSRFGDTAANTGTLALLDSLDSTAHLPVGIKTVAASFSAALFRILLMPVDTIKTTMQVEGKDGFKKLIAKTKTVGPSAFYQGAIASAVATFAGHYPWFFVYNSLNEHLPQYTELYKKLLRSAVIGFCASAVSDTVSNSFRVLKVYKQANTEQITYAETLKRVLAEDGIAGLFGRGLKTKIMANGMQGLMFSVLWRLIDDKFFKKEGDDKKKSRE